MKLPRICSVILAVIGLQCVAGGTSFAGDWSQWLGPSRNGVSAEVIAPWTEQPPVIWRHKAGNGYCSPVIADGIVYIHAAVAGKEEENILAIDLITGARVWSESYPRTAYRSELGVGPRATPAVVNGRIFTFGITGELSSHDAKTGERYWQVNPYTELNASLPGFGVCSSPLVVEGSVIVPVGGTGNGILAYSAETGKLLWSGLDEPAAVASPIVRIRETEEGERIEVIVQTTLRLVGLHPKTGEIYWEHPLVFQPSGVSPTPLALGDLLVCSTQDTGTLTVKLPGKEAASPEQKWWNQEWSSYFSTGTIGADGRAYLVTNAVMPLPRADIRCLNAETGEEQWLKKGVGYFHVGLISAGDGKLLLLDDGGTLILAEPTETELKELSRAKVCGGTFMNPTLSEGRVVVRDNKEVICYDLNQVK
ncbi:MAG: PQQ-binding-like beta-propeller repeat protein [Planctomycetaceae bacterium]